MDTNIKQFRVLNEFSFSGEEVVHSKGEVLDLDPENGVVQSLVESGHIEAADGSSAPAETPAETPAPADETPAETPATEPEVPATAPEAGADEPAA